MRAMCLFSRAGAVRRWIRHDYHADCMLVARQIVVRSGFPGRTLKAAEAIAKACRSFSTRDSIKLKRLYIPVTATPGGAKRQTAIYFLCACCRVPCNMCKNLSLRAVYFVVPYTRSCTRPALCAFVAEPRAAASAPPQIACTMMPAHFSTGFKFRHDFSTQRPTHRSVVTKPAAPHIVIAPLNSQGYSIYSAVQAIASHHTSQAPHSCRRIRHQLR
jgi:hypothetical protein